MAQREIKRTQPLALNIIIYAIADDDNDDDVDDDDEEEEDEDGPRHSASSFMHRFSNTKEILNSWFSNVWSVECQSPLEVVNLSGNATGLKISTKWLMQSVHEWHRKVWRHDIYITQEKEAAWAARDVSWWVFQSCHV